MIAAATGIAAAALSVSPVRLRLAAAASHAITVTNGGTAAAAIDARAASFVLDLRGRPTVARSRLAAAGWLRVRPQRFVLAPGEAAVLTVSSAAPRRASPGDHAALVLLTTQPQRRGSVAIRTQVGVLVLVRVAGRVVHRLALGRLRMHGRTLAAEVLNRGNVVERTQVRVSLIRAGHVVTRLGPVLRTLLPHSRGVAYFRYRGRLHGWATAWVQIGVLRRTVRIRL